jgi:hypothetical protein
MAKGKLLFALEDLEPELPVDETEVPKDLDAAMLAVMEDEQDVEDTITEMDETDDRIEEVESSIERLEALCGVIRKYGISAPIMEAADPYRELVAAGICKAYEELGETPIKDEESEEVADKIEEATEAAGALVASKGVGLAAKAGGSIVGLSPLGMAAVAAVALAARLLVRFGPVVAKAMMSHKRALKAAEKQLGEIASFDDEKFKTASSSALSKDEFKKGMSVGKTVVGVATSDNLDKLASEIEALINGGDFGVDKVEAVSKKAAGFLKPLVNEDVKSMFGLIVEVDDAGLVKVETGSASIKGSKGTMGDKGWDANDAKEAVKEALALTAEAEGIAVSIKRSIATINHVIGTLKKRLKKDGYPADKGAYKEAVATLKKVVNANKVIVKVAVSCVYKLNGSATKVAKAAIKAKA